MCVEYMSNIRETWSFHPHEFNYQEMLDALVIDGALGGLHAEKNNEGIGMFWAGETIKNELGVYESRQGKLAQEFCADRKKIYTLEKVPFGKELEKLHNYMVEEGEYGDYYNWRHISDMFSQRFAQEVSRTGKEIYIAARGASPLCTFRMVELPLLLNSDITHVTTILRHPQNAKQFFGKKMPIMEWYPYQREQWMNYWFEQKNTSNFRHAVWELHLTNLQRDGNLFSLPQWDSTYEDYLFEMGRKQLVANYSEYIKNFDPAVMYT